MTTYTVVSDRYSRDPVETTLELFIRDCEELGWGTPNIVSTTDGDYIDADTGEVILQKN